MIRIEETDTHHDFYIHSYYEGGLTIDDGGEMHIDIDRERAAQLAEVLKRYAETGRLEE